MKKVLLITSGITLGLLLILGSCTKTNIKNGNKNIIGTWELTLETTVGTGNGTSTTTYSPTNTCWSDYVSTWTESYSIEITQNSVTESNTHTSTQNGETNTESNDTTYTITRNTQITFNEDGTCKIIDYRTNVDDDGNPDNESMEMEGYWNWLDAYEEKTGINIVVMGMDQRKASGGPDQAMEMHFYIDILEKEELKLAYTSTFLNSYEYTYYNGSCYNADTQLNEDIYRGNKSSGTNAEAGNMEFIKVE